LRAAALPVVSEPKAFGPIYSIHPEGSWQYDEDHQAQCFSQAMSQVDRE